MYLGIDREEAARFSFLLALPAILGAAMLEAWELFGSRLTLAAALPLVAGFITSYLSGVVALRWLLGVIRRGRLDRFAYYCFAVGLVGIWIAGRG
jgi:undecaprenyl-diphosphatase